MDDCQIHMAKGEEEEEEEQMGIWAWEFGDCVLSKHGHSLWPCTRDRRGSLKEVFLASHHLIMRRRHVTRRHGIITPMPNAHSLLYPSPTNAETEITSMIGQGVESGHHAEMTDDTLAVENAPVGRECKGVSWQLLLVQDMTPCQGKARLVSSGLKPGGEMLVLVLVLVSCGVELNWLCDGQMACLSSCHCHHGRCERIINITITL